MDHTEGFGKNNLEELTAEVLELVHGGVVSDSAAVMMNATIKVFKKHGYTPQFTIEWVLRQMDNANFAGMTAEEAAAYINANWDLI